ncbi:MAG: glycosyltransferase family 2 protein [Candidatus Omnitrophota bacterium]|jgi:glycosyltransferase involved in cell wall biosynthesis
MAELSVIVPVYNEETMIAGVIKKIIDIPIDKEIIVVDDGSSDGTGKILRAISYPNVKIIHHGTNRGKGAAVLTGLSHASGEYLIVQDADFEYDPHDYMKLLEQAKLGKGDIILGARFMKGYFGMAIPKIGNRLLTGLVNILFGVRLNDCFTCYKLMRRTSILDLGLVSGSFDIEIEILAKAIKKKLRIVEVPVTYQPRTYSQGKKIRIRDGLWAVVRIFKFRFN